MKIGIQSWGSHGDNRPLLALASGLAAAGHEIIFSYASVDNRDYSEKARKFGIKSRKIASDFFLSLDINPLLPALIRAPHFIGQLQIVLGEMFSPVVEDIYQDAKQLVEESDLVIGHFIVHPLFLAAEKTGKPFVSVILNHMGLPTTATPPIGLPNLGKHINPMLWNFAQWAIEKGTIGLTKHLWSREGVKPIGMSLNSAFNLHNLKMILVGVSNLFYQNDLCNDPRLQVCGFLNLPDELDDWTIPEELEQFLHNGPPPIFMTFGSMISLDDKYSQHIRESTLLLIEATRKAGCRSIIQSEWEQLGDLPDHPDIYRIGRVPHRHLFPRCAAVVHHGGAGTSHSATYYGCPSIVVAHLLDQPFWGDQLEKIGIAPKTLCRKNLNPSMLAKRMREVLANPLMKQRAEQARAILQSENGLARAVELLRS